MEGSEAGKGRVDGWGTMTRRGEGRDGGRSDL